MSEDASKFLCEEVFQDFLVKREKRVWRHLVLVSLLIIQFSPELVNIFSSYQSYELARAHQITLIQLASIFSAFLLIYINLLWLIPAFLLKKKYPIYFAMTTLELAVNFAVSLYLQFSLANLVNAERTQYVASSLFSIENVIQTVTIPTVFLGSIVGVVLCKQWLMKEQTIKVLQEEKLKTELRQLKNQINPHFLFNTLNNINSLIHIDPSKASQIVMGLSDVLRYNLYESNNDRVLLKKEIEVYAHILELEKIRRSRFECKVIQFGDCANVFVPPFLFINFIENSIKYSADDRDKSFIEISFNRLNEKIEFRCKNSVANNRMNTLGGLGLSNVKRRLELLYGANFNLVTSRSENQYAVTLSLPLE